MKNNISVKVEIRESPNPRSLLLAAIEAGEAGNFEHHVIGEYMEVCVGEEEDFLVLLGNDDDDRTYYTIDGENERTIPPDLLERAKALIGDYDGPDVPGWEGGFAENH